MKKLLIIFALAILSGFESCKPKESSEINDFVLADGLTTSQYYCANSLERFYNLVGGFWAQYWAQSNASNRYRCIENYRLDQESSYIEEHNLQWNSMYAEVLYTCKSGIKQSEFQYRWDFYLMNTVLYVYTFHLMTDCYNAIPYSEALGGNTGTSIRHPKYDEGFEIYEDLLVLVDEALNKAKHWDTEAVIESDLIFSGDIVKWRKFANTLKLKMYLRMAEAKPDLASAGILELYRSNAEFLDTDAFLDIYESSSKTPNPLYYWDRIYYSIATNLKISTTLSQYYLNHNDPRIASIIDLKYEKDTTNSLGMPQGGYNISVEALDHNKVDVFKISVNQPVYLMSEVESYLLQSEAIARGWGDGDDQFYYNLAVSTDFKRKGLLGKEADFIADGGDYEFPVSGNLEAKLEAIGMAKWAAFAGTQGLEAFMESNRLDYPKNGEILSWVNSGFNPDYKGGILTYSLSAATNGNFPKRFIYPNIELEVNNSNPGQSEVTDKIWWDIK